MTAHNTHMIEDITVKIAVRAPNIDALLEPRSVALIGASPDATIIRGRIQHALDARGFAGPVYPVSRSHTEIQGARAYASIGEVPSPVDMAVIMIPAAAVPEALRECGEAGVKAAYIISSGFSEEGETGAALQADVVAIARQYGIAVGGPNAEGFLNLPAKVVSTFSPAVENWAQPMTPEASRGGPIAIVSQSGGLGFAYFSRARARQLRIDHVFSTGNEAVLTSFDFVDWYLSGDRADVIMLYAETIRGGDTFHRVAARAADLGKPLVIAKMGRSDVGVRASASHTAALAGDDKLHDALFRSYGITRALDMDQQLDIAAAFAFCDLPKGNRVCVIAGSGGAGVWMADLCAVYGLAVPVLDDATRAELDKLIPSFGSSANPIDPTAVIRRVGYVKLLEIVARSPVIDAIIIVGNLTDLSTLKRDAAALTELVETIGKPVLFGTPSLPTEEAYRVAADAGLPVFTNMPNCAVAMRALVDYADFQRRWQSREQSVGGSARARGATDAALSADRLLGAGGRILGEHESKSVLAAYGIMNDADIRAADAEAAVAAAVSIGFPVALKVDAAGLAHKTEAGGVELGLADVDEVRGAFADIVSKVSAAYPHVAVDGVLVQAMAKPGVEMVIGLQRDPELGPLVMFGLGGIHVEVLGDVIFAPAPISAAEVKRLMEGLRGYRLLTGHRKMPPADIDAFADTVATVSRLAVDCEEIAEIDLNPVIVHANTGGVTIVDALIVTRQP